MNLEAGSYTQNLKYCCSEIKANNSDITRIPQGKWTWSGNGKRAFELLPVCFYYEEHSCLDSRPCPHVPQMNTKISSPSVQRPAYKQKEYSKNGHTVVFSSMQFYLTFINNYCQYLSSVIVVSFRGEKIGTLIKRSSCKTRKQQHEISVSCPHGGTKCIQKNTSTL